MRVDFKRARAFRAHFRPNLNAAASARPIAMSEAQSPSEDLDYKMATWSFLKNEYAFFGLIGLLLTFFILIVAGITYSLVKSMFESESEGAPILCKHHRLEEKRRLNDPQQPITKKKVRFLFALQNLQIL